MTQPTCLAEQRQEHKRYPAIRLFVSSAFLGMEEERRYFNDIITPKLRALCRDKGVSFFSVDLRWGITEEDIERDRLIPLCFGEIDECLPFFLGLIGNRYGSRISSFSGGLLARYPWLSEHVNASYTELEILYRFAQEDRRENTLFLFKECPSSTDSTEAASIEALKNHISEEAPQSVTRYDSLASLEETVLARFSAWLDDMFGREDVHTARERLYLHQIECQTEYDPAQEKSIRACIEMAQANVLVHADVPVGKTSLLNRVAAAYPNSIVINCRADEANASLPYVIGSICRRLLAAEGVSIGNREKMNELLSLTEQKRLLRTGEEEQLCKDFLAVLGGTRCAEPTLLVINDIEYVAGDLTKYLQWLPSVSEGGLRIVCSTGDRDIVESARVMNWQLLPLHPMGEQTAESILREALGRLGKNPADALPLLRSPLACCPGYLLSAIDYLNCFAAYDTVRSLSERLAQSDSFDAYYDTLFADIAERQGRDEREDLLLALGVMALNELPTDEDCCYSVLHAVAGCDSLRWSEVSRLISALRLSEGGGYLPKPLRRYLLKTLSSHTLSRLHGALGDYHLSRTDSACMDESADEARRVRAALLHFAAAERYDRIHDVLGREGVLSTLAAVDRGCLRRVLFAFASGTGRSIAVMIADEMDRILSPGEKSEGEREAFCGLLALYEDLFLVREQSRIDRLVREALGREVLDRKAWRDLQYEARVMHTASELVAQLGVMGALARLDEMAAMAGENAEQAACLAAIKADLMLRHRHCDVLPYTEQALTLAIKAASVRTILHAYDLKVTALLRLERYEEALSLAERGQGWARGTGYVSFLISFSNSRAVALYRLGARGDRACFDESIALSEKNLSLCLRWGQTHNAAVCMKSIGLAMNLKGDYDGCIAYLEKQLKNKQLAPMQRRMLNDVLIAAYGNKGMYEKSRKAAAEVLAFTDPEDGAVLRLKTVIALSSVMRDGELSKRSLELITEALTLAHTKRNHATVHQLLRQLFPLLICSAEGTALWNKWKDTPGGDDYVRSMEHYDPSVFPNGYRMFAVCHLPRVRVSISRMVSSYRIAMERAMYDEAAEIAQKLGAMHEENDPSEAGRWYCNAAIAHGENGDRAAERGALLEGVRVLMHEGCFDDAEVMNDIRVRMTAQDAARLDRWIEAGRLLREEQADPFPILEQITSDVEGEARFRRYCFADLAPRMLLCLTPRQIIELKERAEQAGLITTDLEVLCTKSMEMGFERYNEVFGKQQVNRMAEVEKKYASFVSASGCFEIIGGTKEEVLEEPFRIRMQRFVVRPLYTPKRLDDVFATVAVSTTESGKSLMCIADVSMMSMARVFRDSAQSIADAYNAEGIGHVSVSPDGGLKYVYHASFGEIGELPAAYLPYARQALRLIRQVDELVLGAEGK